MFIVKSDIHRKPQKLQKLIYFSILCSIVMVFTLEHLKSHRLETKAILIKNKPAYH